jgi:hypothetical protein
MKRACLAVLMCLAASCGGDDDGGGIDVAVGPGIDASGPDAMGGAMVPDPGTAVGGEWTDVEPNDTPEDAVPVGQVQFAIWAGFAPPYTQIDNPTDVDYYVFRAPAQADLAGLNMQFCWGGAIDLLDLYLYEVVNMTQGALVRSAATTNTSCETIIAPGDGPTYLTADAVYLLEVRAAPSLPASTPATMYGA